MLSDNIIMLPVDLFYFACKGQKYASIQFIHTVVCINVVRIYFILPYVLYVRLSDIQRNILLLSYCKFWILLGGCKCKIYNSCHIVNSKCTIYDYNMTLHSKHLTSQCNRRRQTCCGRRRKLPISGSLFNPPFSSIDQKIFKRDK